MAKADWCTVAPMSGNGDATLTISAPAHTGRVDRSTTVTVQAANGTKPSAAITVNQAGAGTITTMEESGVDVPKTGGTVTINGTSNSPTFTYSLTCIAAGVPLELADGTNGVSYAITINGIRIASGAEIPGDPGEAGMYDFVATILLPASPLPIDAKVVFKVLDNSETKKECTFTWKAGASRISLSKSSVPLINSGGSDTVGISSNDDWTVS